MQGPKIIIISIISNNNYNNNHFLWVGVVNSSRLIMPSICEYDHNHNRPKYNLNLQ